MLRLSKNFRLSELTKSSTALRRNIDNTPDHKVVYNLEYLCCRVLQPVRDHFELPVTVNSGYRSPELNAAVGSSSRSQHTTGMAVDFEIAGIDNFIVAKWVQDNLEFDQLILEFYDGTPTSGWVHVSLKESGNRNEVLTINNHHTSRGLVGG